MNPSINVVLRRLARVAPHLLATRYRPDCCIVASRVAIECLDRLGVRGGLPLPVTMEVLNPTLTDHFAANLPKTQEDMDVMSQPPGSWGVGIGFGAQAAHDPTKWGGHLVVVVSGNLVDLSAPQVNRPAHGIDLPAIAKPVPRGFPEDLAAAFVVNGCLVRYEAVPGNDGYKETPDWTGVRHRPLVEQIVATIRSADRRKRA